MTERERWRFAIIGSKEKILAPFYNKEVIFVAFLCVWWYNTRQEYGKLWGML